MFFIQWILYSHLHTPVQNTFNFHLYIISRSIFIIQFILIIISTNLIHFHECVTTLTFSGFIHNSINEVLFLLHAPEPLAAKQPHSGMLQPLYFTISTMFFEFRAPLILPNILLVIGAEQFHLCFIRPKNTWPESFIFILVLPCIFQPGLQAAFLKKGLSFCSVSP